MLKQLWNPVFLPCIYSKEQDKISNKQFCLSPVEGNGSSDPSLLHITQLVYFKLLKKCLNN